MLILNSNLNKDPIETIPEKGLAEHGTISRIRILEIVEPEPERKPKHWNFELDWSSKIKTTEPF
jgi:hypothetical protein